MRAVALPARPPTSRRLTSSTRRQRSALSIKRKGHHVGFIGYLISLIVVGLVIGGLGRLIIPGPNPIGLAATAGVGLAGSILGAIVGAVLGLGAISIVFELAISAGLVYSLSSRGGGRRQLRS